MAKTWEELEEEEALKHRSNILGAKSRRDIQKENERYQKARIRIGEMHTAQTLGADWREREAKKRSTPEYQAARAQEALASNVAESRERNRKQLTPLEENVTRRKMELPGGGTAEFGIGTLANMRAYEQKQKDAKEAQRKKVAESIGKMREDFRERNKQRYEQNLAERGLRNPTEGATPEERRRIENENNAARMADFRKQTSARQLADLKERQFLDMYADMPKSFKDQQIGGDSSNMTARRRYFETLANEEVRRELSDRAELRRKINAQRTTANPEAAPTQPTPTPAQPTAPTPQPPVAPTPEPPITPTAPAEGETAVPAPENPFQEAAQQEAERRSKAEVEKEKRARADQIAKLTEQIESLAPRPKSGLLEGLVFGNEQAELKSKYDKLWLERDKLMAIDEGRVFKSLQEAKASGLPKDTIVYINDKPQKL